METRTQRRTALGPKRLLTVNEAAIVLGISRSTLFDAVKKGRVPFPVHRIGGCRYIPKAALDRMLDGDWLGARGEAV